MDANIIKPISRLNSRIVPQIPLKVLRTINLDRFIIYFSESQGKHIQRYRRLIRCLYVKRYRRSTRGIRVGLRNHNALGNRWSISRGRGISRGNGWSVGSGKCRYWRKSIRSSTRRGISRGRRRRIGLRISRCNRYGCSSRICCRTRSGISGRVSRGTGRGKGSRISRCICRRFCGGDGR